MTGYVADTHALFWYLIDSPRLGSRAGQILEEGEAGRAEIFIPTIAIAEMHYANVKRGLPLVMADAIARLETSGRFTFVPLDHRDVLEFDADARVTEMHDRIIVGVARRLGVACLTVDANITASGIVPTIW